MKTNLKNLGILLIIIVALVFCLNVYLADAEENYRCFAELYPEKAEQAKIPALGETAIINGNKIRVMAEAAHPEIDQWIQWIDVEPVDNVCDYAVSFKFMIDGSIGFRVFNCDRITEIIKHLNYTIYILIPELIHITQFLETLSSVNK